MGEVRSEKSTGSSVRSRLEFAGLYGVWILFELQTEPLSRFNARTYHGLIYILRNSLGALWRLALSTAGVEDESQVRRLCQSSRREGVLYRHGGGAGGKKYMKWIHILDARLRKLASGLGSAACDGAGK